MKVAIFYYFMIELKLHFTQKNERFTQKIFFKEDYPYNNLKTPACHGYNEVHRGTE